MPKAQMKAPKPKDTTTDLAAADDGAGMVLFTATVNAGSPAPTGTITFSDGTTVIAKVPVDGPITSVANLPPSVTAIYSGDSKWKPSKSQTLTPPYIP